MLKVCRQHLNIGTVTPVTTRAPRRGEEDGIDYYFTSRHAFRRSLVAGDFAVWDYIIGEYYGYVGELTRVATSGEDAAVVVNARMGVQLSQRLPNVVTLFIDVREGERERRLKERGMSSKEAYARSLYDAEQRELGQLFDYVEHGLSEWGHQATLSYMSELFGRS